MDLGEFLYFSSPGVNTPVGKCVFFYPQNQKAGALHAVFRTGIIICIESGLTSAKEVGIKSEMTIYSQYD